MVSHFKEISHPGAPNIPKKPNYFYVPKKALPLWQVLFVFFLKISNFGPFVITI